MSRSTQITGKSAPKKKKQKAAKQYATLEMNIFGVPRIIAEYVDPGKPYKYPPASRDDESDLEIPKVPKVEIIKE